MAPPPDDEHDCGWKTRATDLETKLAETAAKLEAVAASMAAMERRFLGPKSEKLPAMDREVRKKRPPDPAAAQVTRRKNAELRATRVVAEDVAHKVPASERKCPKCSSVDLRPVGTGKTSTVLDYVPGVLQTAAALARDPGMPVRGTHHHCARSRPLDRRRPLRRQFPCVCGRLEMC
jgi:hypothetical protein